MKVGRWLIPASFAGAVVLAGAACAFIDSPSQCATDSDCARFDAVCDPAQSICVSRESLDRDAAGQGDGASPPSSEVDGDTSPPLPPKCTVTPKPVGSATEGLPAGADGGAQLTGAHTLDCDKDWTLDGPIVVAAGGTLTISAGTTIRAKKATNAAIIVLPGGRIVASGQRNAPIVLTVDDPAPAAGDWKGLVVLGKAPRTGTNPFNGEALFQYGGAAPDDDSGMLSFIRVEYAQLGAVFGGVGRTTKVDSIQVRRSNDNCFVFTGGTVNASHLVCQVALDEQFEISSGYAGKLQFLFGQRVAPGEGHNGFLIEGDTTAPVIYNTTICGLPNAANAGQGLVFRNNTKLDANNMIIMNWLAGIDAQSANLGTPLLLRSSILFGNSQNPAFAEDDAGAGQALNEDEGFDEIGFFRDAGGGNAETNPNVVDCLNQMAPKPWPNAAITAGARTPPNDGFFDVTAAYIGAFKDANDPWMTGPWVRFAAD